MADSKTERSDKESIQALERFVVENDDLFELEQRIGRFNVFDALRIVDVEIRHSNFLAWLLDPNESHNQGGLFLRAFLVDLLRQSNPDQRPKGLSPITLDGGDLRGVEVRREWHNIDLLIRCEEPHFVIAIENKIRAGEHSNQLRRYKDTVNKHFGNAPRQFVYLTPEGDEPSDEDWTVYDYGSMHDVIKRIVDSNHSAIGDDVLAFTQHYLGIIRSKLMDDPKIDDLCRRIYQNHRQAIQLIIDKVGASATTALIALEDAIHEMDDWRIVNRTSKFIQCQPSSWALPPINKRKKFKADEWLFIQISFNIPKRMCVASLRACPTKDPELRQAIIKRLIRDPKEFGVKTFFKQSTNIGASWTTLSRTKLLSWSEDEPPNDADVVVKVREYLEKQGKALKEVQGAIEPIIEEWQREQKS